MKQIVYLAQDVPLFRGARGVFFEVWITYISIYDLKFSTTNTTNTFAKLRWASQRFTK
jgi:hypothetical protein